MHTDGRRMAAVQLCKYLFAISVKRMCWGLCKNLLQLRRDAWCTHGLWLITAHRIISISEQIVRFKYKDYADGDKQKEMALSIAEFLRRFELHILPKRFVKIRHYGLLQNHGKTKRLNVIRQQLRLSPLPAKVQIPVSQRMLEKFGKDITLCPRCNKGKLVWMCTTYAKEDNSIFRRKLSRDEQTAAILNNKASP